MENIEKHEGRVVSDSITLFYFPFKKFPFLIFSYGLQKGKGFCKPFIRSLTIVHSHEEVVEILHVFLKLHPSTTALYPNISACCLFLSVASIKNPNVLTFYLFVYSIMYDIVRTIFFLWFFNSFILYFEHCVAHNVNVFLLRFKFLII